MSLSNSQKNTERMIKLIEIELMLDNKTLQDGCSLRVRVLHTRMYRTIHQMQRNLSEIMEGEEIDRIAEKNSNEDEESEIERLHRI